MAEPAKAMDKNPFAVEGLIWFLLALCCLYKDRSDYVALVTTVHLSWQLWRCRGENVRFPNEQKLWRHFDQASSDTAYMYNGDGMGVYMSIALVPILFKSMAEGLLSPQKQQLQSIALIISLIQIPLWQHVRAPMRTPLRRFLSVLMFCIGVFAVLAFFQSSVDWFDPTHRTYAATFAFTWSWLVCLSMLGPGEVEALRGAMSIGEWFVVSSFLAFVFSQWVTVLVYANNASSIDSSSALNTYEEVVFAYVAASGVFGCAFACMTVGFVQSTARKMFPTLLSKSISSVEFRVLYLISLTFGIIELCFRCYPGLKEYHSPKSLWWIFGDFLLSVEDSPWKDAFTTFYSQYAWFLPFSSAGINQILQLPRLTWLMYWFLMMAVTIPIAPSTGRISPVIARKWFHFITVILFTPATIFVPQLQSLSYAIAIAVLLLIESIRHYVGWLNHFYVIYLDSNKDETDDATIISHIALVAGCAAPLWLLQYYSYYRAVDIAVTDSPTLSLLLGLWGVWVLGIGDAMGAIIGRRFGRVKWGCNHRTLEGSASMLFSLCMACIASTALFDSSTLWTNHVGIWLPAVLFVTFLEAYTMQIDNIVLPVAGGAVMFAMLHFLKP